MSDVCLKAEGKDGSLLGDHLGPMRDEVVELSRHGCVHSQYPVSFQFALYLVARLGHG